ncbi:MAG: c-type cytochrome, partial [Verrucomicrobiota bacterium]
HDFVGVGVMLGPDGALYYSDWVDTQTCHHRDVEIWDRANGRIYRVRYGEARTTQLDLPKQSDAELVRLLGDANAFVARQAQRLLQERAASGALERESAESALREFEVGVKHLIPLRLRAFWTRHVTGLLSGEIVMEALDDENEYLRGWAVQLAMPNEGTIPKFESMAASDPSLLVRRYLAAKLQQIPFEVRWNLAERLIQHARSGHDPNIPLLCWYGIEPLVDLDSDRAFSLAEKTPWPDLKDFLSRRGVVTPEGREAILRGLAGAKAADAYAQQGAKIASSLAKLPPVQTPNSWGAAKAQGKALASASPQVASVLRKLGARFGDAEFFPPWRELALNRKANVPRRVEAINLLIAGGDPELKRIGVLLLEHPLMREAAIRAIRSQPSVVAAETVVEQMNDFSLSLRNEAINFLASRPEFALVLLTAVAEDRVEPSLVSPVMLNQFDLFEDEKIDALISAHWTRGVSGVEMAKLHEAIEEWKGKLGPGVMAKANASRGRQVYKMSCGTCHQLFGEGIALGPDLTGSNRADLGYILENVLAPSAVVGKDYMLNIFSLKDGSTVSGMVQRESPEFYRVSMPGGALIEVRKSEVASRQEMAQSLMPAGLFDALPLEQVADLVSYLASPQQVPLPGEEEASLSQSPNKPAGPSIEAETLVGQYAPDSGTVLAQKMDQFGPQWSGNRQLFWKGGAPGDVYTLKLEGLNPGTVDLTIVPTTARDYAKVKFSINGQLRDVDLYSEQVVLGNSILFPRVNISPRESLQIDIHITGQNEETTSGRHFVGIDRFEVRRSETDLSPRDGPREESALLGSE